MKTEIGRNKSESSHHSSEQSRMASDLSSYTPQQLESLRGFWAYMTRLYGHKWSSSQGTMIDGNSLGYGAQMWLKTLCKLTDEQKGVGRMAIEGKIKKNAQNGLESFPPSDIEFEAMCKPVRARGHKPFAKPLMLESDESKQKRKEAGKKHCQQIKDLLGE